MPHAEIKYSGDLNLPLQEIFTAIEETIRQVDTSSGECKCRAYKSDDHKYPHVLISLTLLTKAHRDDAFSDRMMEALESAVKALISQSCYFSMTLDYSGRNYRTNLHMVPGDTLPRYGDTVA